MGDINSHLTAFEESLKHSETDLEQLANSMLVIMVKGLFSRVQFPCSAVRGDQLFQPFWEAVCRLERCGFKVLGLTCDGLSANRRLFKMHQSGTELAYKVPNPYATDGRDLFFLSDPPHLLKTTRNCWANMRRQLWVGL